MTKELRPFEGNHEQDIYDIGDDLTESEKEDFIPMCEFNRKEGVQAVIDLWMFVGIEVTRERAERDWDSFAASEKEKTMKALKLYIQNSKN